MSGVLRMAHPDACPLCHEIHGQISPAWACPQHGHRLSLDLASPGRDMYVCPVWRCPVRRPARLPEDVPQTGGLLTEDIPSVMRGGFR